MGVGVQTPISGVTFSEPTVHVSELTDTYRDGQKCDDESSDDCTTVHAFVLVDSNTPGFTSNGGGFSNTDYYKGPAYADVTFRCTGDCGVVSTEKIEPYHINGQ